MTITEERISVSSDLYRLRLTVPGILIVAGKKYDCRSSSLIVNDSLAEDREFLSRNMQPPHDFGMLLFCYVDGRRRVLTRPAIIF